MKKVSVSYMVSFGKWDDTDWMERTVELTDDEAVYYDNAVKNNRNPNEIIELEDALCRAYEEIEKDEIRKGIEMKDEYVLECLGLDLVNATEINKLISERDTDTLRFFGLEDFTDDELEEWKEKGAEQLPCVRDFKKDFVACSPYDEGWILDVRFVDPND